MQEPRWMLKVKQTSGRPRQTWFDLTLDEARQRKLWLIADPFVLTVQIVKQPTFPSEEG